MARITDDLMKKLIAQEGTVDGITPPNATGVLRLALDLQDARRRVRELEAQITNSQIRRSRV